MERIKILKIAFVAALIIVSPAASRDIAPTPPSLIYGDLFRNVGESGLFPDFKTFADAIPNRPPSEILADYRKQHPTSRAALSQFIKANFRFEQDHAATQLPPPGLPLLDHIARLWPYLTKDSRREPPYSTSLTLPEPYIVPGGRFYELYYWDTYFTMLGLGPGEAKLRDGMIADFASELYRFGHIPNGSRSYYLSRSQPPFFFMMVSLTDADPAKAYAHFLPELKLEYDYWMAGADTARPGEPVRHVVRLPDGALLNRYWDERDAPRDEVWPVDVANAKGAPDRNQFYRDARATAESGWDFSSRWFADGQTIATLQTTRLVPPDLNSLLYGLERAIESGCRFKADDGCARDFAERAENRRAAMTKYLWNGSMFDDFRWTDGKTLGHVSAAAYYPLFFRVASREQAEKTEASVTPELLKEGGIVTTPVNTGQQWDAPNGWAPLQWIAEEGLKAYDFENDAHEIACRWIANVSRVYSATGRLVEKYNVVSQMPGGGGEYPNQDGFGWTNGVTAALMKQYPDCQAAMRGR